MIPATVCTEALPFTIRQEAGGFALETVLVQPRVRWTRAYRFRIAGDGQISAAK